MLQASTGCLSRDGQSGHPFSDRDVLNRVEHDLRNAGARSLQVQHAIVPQRCEWCRCRR